MSGSQFIYSIGDVHGCFTQLQHAYDFIQKTDPNGEIVMLGDYVDRGPASMQVVEFLRTEMKDAIALKGNHEDMMVKAVDGEDNMNIWLMNGGFETLQSYGIISIAAAQYDEAVQAHVKWMRGLPLYHETENHIFVHAGLLPNHRLATQYEEHLLWIRNPFLLADKSNFPDGKHIVHGHTPSRYPDLKNHRSGLDTGCFHYGVLTVGKFDRTRNRGPVEVFYFDPHGRTEKP